MNGFVQATIPKALSDLSESHNNIKQIATYCKNAYSSGDPNKVYEQTQNYTKDALLNVAYHIQTIGSHITSLLELQANEIDKLDIQIRAISDRMKACHDATGAAGFRTKDSAKVYQKTTKVRKLEGPQVPEAAKPLIKYVRRPIRMDLDATTPLPTPTPQPQYQPTSATATATAAPQATPAHRSILFGPPPTISAPPPQLNLPVPPPRGGAPPPPPPVEYANIPPPPPPIFDGMPPPPPPPFLDDGFALPPPSFDDLPPPPVGFFPPPPPPM